MKIKTLLAVALLATGYSTVQAIPHLGYTLTIEHVSHPSITVTLADPDPLTTRVDFLFFSHLIDTTSPFVLYATGATGGPYSDIFVAGPHILSADIYVSGVYSETVQTEFDMPRLPDSGSTGVLLSGVCAAGAFLRRKFAV